MSHHSIVSYQLHAMSALRIDTATGALSEAGTNSLECDRQT